MKLTSRFKYRAQIKEVLPGPSGVLVIKPFAGAQGPRLLLVGDVKQGGLPGPPKGKSNNSSKHQELLDTEWFAFFIHLHCNPVKVNPVRNVRAAV